MSEKLDKIVEAVANRVTESVRNELQQPAAAPTAVPRNSGVRRVVRPVASWLRAVTGRATKEDREVLDLFQIEPKASLVVPLNLTGGLDTSNTDTVPTNVAQSIIETIGTASAIRSVATVLPTSGNGNVTVPVFDDSGNEAELVSLSSGSDMTTSVAPAASSITLGLYTLQSKPAVLGYTLIEESTENLEQTIGRVLGMRLALKANYYMTNGTGSGQPVGILAATGGIPTKVTAASATAIDWKELVDLVYSINQVYRQNATWMMHSNVLAAVQELEDSNGRPLYYPDLVNGGGRLLGFPVVENNDMPSALATGAKVIAFGDFSRVYVREMNAVKLTVLKERFAEYDAIGLLANYYFDAAPALTANTEALGVLQMA